MKISKIINMHTVLAPTRVKRLKEFFHAGVDSDGDTPDSIPNSEVKSISGDGSAGATLWESSTVPAL